MNDIGRIEVINEVQHINEELRKRTIVLKIVDVNGDKTYENLYEYEFFNDKADLLDKYKVGQMVEVGFRRKGRAWLNPQGIPKYFVSHNAWMIKSVGDEQPAAPTYQDSAPQPAPVQQAQEPPPMPSFQPDSEDTPF